MAAPERAFPIGRVLVALAAAGIAVLAFSAGYPKLIYDSYGYYELGRILRTTGLSAWPLDTRTYGYPLFVALATGWRDRTPELARLLVFAAQLLIWLAVSALAARRLARIVGSPGAGTAAFAISALNPVLLIATTEVLSDLVSAALVLAAVALTWRSPAGASSPAGAAFLAFLAAGLAVMARPANLIVVPALALVWIVRLVRWKEPRLRVAAAALAGLLPPFVPQAILNARAFGTWNPLISKNLYALQASWGTRALKYATLVVPGFEPELVYRNPLFRGDADPAAFLRNHPLHYAATLALHGFGMLDRDLPFTYVTDLSPWYRWPVSLVNLLILCLAAAGLAAGLARLAVRRRIDEAGFVVVATAAVAAAYLALYLPVEVESRFGLALQALAMPLIVTGAAAVAGSGPRRRTLRVAAAAAVPAALAAGVLLSSWLARQRTAPAPASTDATVVSSTPPR